MSDWVLATFAGGGNTGFRLIQERSTNVDSVWAGKFEEAMRVEFPQLQTSLSTQSWPIWDLFFAESLGDRWTFVLRGAGGPYGSAGTTQFLVGSTEQRPADVWMTAMGALSEANTIDPALLKTPSAAALARPTQEECDLLLRTLLANEATHSPSLLLVPLPAGKMPALILAALDALPIELIQSVRWGTCHLRSRQPDTAQITGQIPAELAEVFRREQRVMDHYSRRPVPMERLSKSQCRAVEWASHEIAAGVVLPAWGGSTSLSVYLDLLHESLPWTEEQIDRVLRGAFDVGRQERLLDNPKQVEIYTRSGDRLRRFALWSDDCFRMSLEFGEARLIEGNPLGFPTHHSRGYSHVLVERIVNLPEGERISFLRRMTESPAGPWASTVALKAASEFLRDCGVTPERAPDLFPLMPGDVGRRIDGGEDPCAIAADALARLDDPWGALTAGVWRGSNLEGRVAALVYLMDHCASPPRAVEHEMRRALSDLSNDRSGLGVDQVKHALVDAALEYELKAELGVVLTRAILSTATHNSSATSKRSARVSTQGLHAKMLALSTGVPLSQVEVAGRVRRRFAGRVPRGWRIYFSRREGRRPSGTPPHAPAVHVVSTHVRRRRVVVAGCLALCAVVVLLFWLLWNRPAIGILPGAGEQRSFSVPAEGCLSTDMAKDFPWKSGRQEPLCVVI